MIKKYCNDILSKNIWHDQFVKKYLIDHLVKIWGQNLRSNLDRGFPVKIQNKIKVKLRVKKESQTQSQIQGYNSGSNLGLVFWVRIQGHI